MLMSLLRKVHPQLLLAKSFNRVYLTINQITLNLRKELKLLENETEIYLHPDYWYFHY